MNQVDEMFERLRSGLPVIDNEELRLLAQKVVERLEKNPPTPEQIKEGIKNFAIWSASFND